MDTKDHKAMHKGKHSRIKHRIKMTEIHQMKPKDGCKSYPGEPILVKPQKDDK